MIVLNILDQERPVAWRRFADDDSSCLQVCRGIKSKVSDETPDIHDDRIGRKRKIPHVAIVKKNLRYDACIHVVAPQRDVQAVFHPNLDDFSILQFERSAEFS